MIKPKKVMVIDDDPVDLTVLRSLLVEMDFEPLVEQDPEKGIVRILKEQPDIILLDIMMPGIDGFEICRKIKNDSRTMEIPIIFISAKDDTDDIVKGLDSGAVDYVTKPFRESELKARIGSVCRMLDLQEKLSVQANTDQLTGLPNRALLMDRLKSTLKRAQRQNNYLFAICYLDLDNFKEVNDCLGHFYGDQLLKEVAKRLNTCLRSADTVARMGGDEFTILLDQIRDFSESMTIAERIKKQLKIPVQLKDKELTITASIGIVVSSSGHIEPEVLIRDADTAMYRAKDKGKDCFQLFDPAMQEKAQQRSDMKLQLQQAIKQKEFVLHYQPIIDLNTGILNGFEALLRWQHPGRGLIPPMEFIPLSEETDMIITIGQWVLEQACYQLSTWQQQCRLKSPLSVSVNLSMKQIMDKDILKHISNTLNASRLEPGCLNLEITESMLMKDSHVILSRLEQIKEMGVGLSLDDFGTGYSSLSYLHRLPVDNLKVDRSFVKRIQHNNDDNNSNKIIKTIVWLARHLGLNTIAEGIETPEQLAYIKKLGCQYGQGYLLSKPLTQQAAEDFIDQSREIAIDKRPSGLCT